VHEVIEKILQTHKPVPISDNVTIRRVKTIIEEAHEEYLKDRLKGM